MDLNVLIVDDEPVFSDLMKLRLRKESPHFSISVVDSGMKCLEHLKSNHVDCILSDFQMPGMDGMELLKTLRSQGNTVPFIFITAQGNEAVARDAFKNGAYDYFTKDIGFAHFTRIINSVEQAVAKRTSDTERRRSDEALRASQKYLQTIIDTEPECVKLIAADGTLLMMNRAGLEMIDADSLDQVKGKSVYGLIVPEYREAFKALGDKVFQGGSGTLEFEIVGFKGTHRWLETHAVPLRNERDQITALLGITRDITERKQAEEALRDSEKRFHAIFESAEDGIFLVNESAFVDCNLKGAMMYGYKDKNEILGRSYLEFSPQLQPDGKNSEEENRRMVALVFSGEPQNFYWQSLRRDGSPFDVEVSLNCLYLKGNPYIQAIVRDIAARKQAEEELKYKNMLLTAQQEATVDGILVVDANGKIISYNRRFLEIWGIPVPQEVLDTRSDEIAIQVVLPYLKNPEEFIERVNYLYEHPTDTSKDEIQLKDGRTFDRYTAPMRGADGMYYGRVWYLRDVTERKNLESQKEHLLEILRHDMKTPLSVIMGNAELALMENDGSLSEDIVNTLQSIHASSKVLSKLLDDQVVMFNIESGGLNPCKEKVDVGEVLTEASLCIVNLARNKGLTFDQNIATDLPPLFADRLHVLRAVTNLAQNAVNYTPAGGRIMLSAWSETGGEDEHIHISVSDDGTGIPADEQEKVFEKYHRSANAKNVKGSGLGLAIVKAVAEAHGGRVELQSEAGKGSTFSIVLPLTPMPG